MERAAASSQVEYEAKKSSTHRRSTDSRQSSKSNESTFQCQLIAIPSLGRLQVVVHDSCELQESNTQHVGNCQDFRHGFGYTCHPSSISALKRSSFQRCLQCAFLIARPMHSRFSQHQPDNTARCLLDTFLTLHRLNSCRARKLETDVLAATQASLYDLHCSSSLQVLDCPHQQSLVLLQMPWNATDRP